MKVSQNINHINHITQINVINNSIYCVYIDKRQSIKIRWVQNFLMSVYARLHSIEDLFFNQQYNVLIIRHIQNTEWNGLLLMTEPIK